MADRKWYIKTAGKTPRRKPFFWNGEDFTRKEEEAKPYSSYYSAQRRADGLFGLYAPFICEAFTPMGKWCGKAVS